MPAHRWHGGQGPHDCRHRRLSCADSTSSPGGGNVTPRDLGEGVTICSHLLRVSRLAGPGLGLAFP